MTHTTTTIKKSARQVQRGIKRDIRDARKRWQAVNPETKQKVKTGGIAGLAAAATFAAMTLFEG